MIASHDACAGRKTGAGLQIDFFLQAHSSSEFFETVLRRVSGTAARPSRFGCTLRVGAKRGLCSSSHHYKHPAASSRSAAQSSAALVAQRNSAQRSAESRAADEVRMAPFSCGGFLSMALQQRRREKKKLEGEMSCGWRSKTKQSTQPGAVLCAYPSFRSWLPPIFLCC